jgi:ATP-dependent DNA helicase RecG
MNSLEKDSIMKDFLNSGIDILVATTVVEVGVDVPEATIMVIEHAERFGLAQLHQMRGRIGRGLKKSTCLLLYSENLSTLAKERLKTIRETDDGFLIAEKDLELRGTGDLLGARQSGLPEYKLVDFNKHADLLQTAQNDAKLILEKDPFLLSNRGKNLRLLLYLFEQDIGVKFLQKS